MYVIVWPAGQAPETLNQLPAMLDLISVLIKFRPAATLPAFPINTWPLAKAVDNFELKVFQSLLVK